MGDNIPKKKLLIAVAVLAVAALVFIVVSLISGTTDSKLPEVNPYTNEAYLSSKEVQKKIENMDIYANLDIVVNNLYDFVKVYKGDLATKAYTDYIKNLNGNFAKLYSEVSSSNDVNKYFKDNKEEITKKYGITDIDDFKKLVDYISIYKTEGLSYKEVVLVKDSPVAETDYTLTKVSLTYSNDVTKIINIAVTNDSKSDNPKFVISFE